MVGYEFANTEPKRKNSREESTKKTKWHNYNTFRILTAGPG